MNPKMSGKMNYSSIELLNHKDEGAHYQDPRYGEAAFEKGRKWIEWWYVNGRLKTKNVNTKEKKMFGYMAAIIHIKNNEKLEGLLVPQGNMLISDLDNNNKKSYFSYCNGNPALSTFHQGKLDINLKGSLEDYLKQTPPSNHTHDKTTIDSNSYYKFRAFSSNKYEIKTKGRAVIEPGKIDKEAFEKIIVKNDKKIRKKADTNLADEKEINKQARKMAFEEICEIYSNMGLNLTLERAEEPLIINEDGILKMGGGGDSYYYTFPHLITGGEITVGNETFEIEEGDSWMDHQWGDFGDEQFGWEWFSIRLGNGENDKDNYYANVYLQVDQNKNVINSDDIAESVANIMMPDGEKKVLYLNKDEFSVRRDENEEWNWKYDANELSDHSGINAKFEGIIYPQRFIFDFRIEGKTLSVTLESLFKLQYGYWYWEGFCNAKATWHGEKLSGFSFTELWYPAKKE